MDYRTLEITIQYAEDLNKVNFISKMDVYVVVSISGGDETSKQKTKTTVDHDDGANPTWTFPMNFTVEEAALLQNRLVLDFKIKCQRALGDRVIGEVHVPVKELLDFPAKGRGGATRSFVSYQVKKPNGKPKGKLTFSYQFRGKTTTSVAQPPPPPLEGLHGGSTVAYPVVDPILPPIPQQPEAAEVFAESRTAYYPVVELVPSSPYLLTPPGVYPPIPPEISVVPPIPPELAVVPPRPPVREVYWEPMTAAYTVQEPTPSYTPVASVVYPPILPPAGYLPVGGLKLEWCPPPPPPPCCVYPPPVMQLAPDWWIVDWRYDTRCSGF